MEIDVEAGDAWRADRPGGPRRKQTRAQVPNAGALSAPLRIASNQSGRSGGWRSQRHSLWLSLRSYFDPDQNRFGIVLLLISP